MGVVKAVRIAHYGLPLVCFGLLGPFFEIWSSEMLLRGAWVLLLSIWAVCAMALYGERLELKQSTTEQSKDSVGLLWATVQEIGLRRKKAVRPNEFRVRVNNVQEKFLRHLVKALADDLRVAEPELHANWMVLQHDHLVTKVRDRPVENRPTTRRLSLSDHNVGAAAAAKNSEIYIETDTAASTLYGETLPYRSFISVPILVADEIIGVVNIDATRASIFTETLEWRIKEVGYIIGLLEVESRED
jgi:transcriptional regulator with GAF, ATPase, and Fis domain